MTGYNLATILLNRPDLAVRESPQQWSHHNRFPERSRGGSASSR
ncbi:hypothetical protein [Mycobacterium tuberculosis]|nr:hypothetical protein [Mycobacterium tuberculosis]